MPLSDDLLNCLRLGDIIYDPGAGRLRAIDGRPVALREQSLRLLAELAARNGETVDKDTLVQAVWAREAVSDDSLVQCVKDIRAALGDGKRQMLRTAIGRGYSLHGVREARESPDPPPRILISALRVRGEAPELADLAEGIAEELILTLSHLAGIGITTEEAQRVAALHAIDGRVSRAGGDLRAFMRVTQGETGNVVFAETWRVPLAEAGCLPRRIAARVANALRVLMTAAAGERLRDRPETELDTRELLARADYHMGGCGLGDREAARACLDAALGREARNATALAMRAALATQLILQVGRRRNPDDPGHCLELAERAMDIAPQSDFVLRTRGNLRLWLRGDHEGARVDCERALSVNPCCHLAHLTLAASEILSGAHCAGTARMAALMAPCARTDPGFAGYLSLLGLGQILRGDAAAGLESAGEARARAPTDAWCAYVLVAAAAGGEVARTAGFGRMIEGLDLPFGHFRDLPFTDMRDAAALEERLALSGFRRSP